MKRISHKLIIWMVTSIFICLPIASAAEQGSDKKASTTVIAESSERHKIFPGKIPRQFCNRKEIRHRFVLFDRIDAGVS